MKNSPVIASSRRPGVGQRARFEVRQPSGYMANAKEPAFQGGLFCCVEEIDGSEGRSESINRTGRQEVSVSVEPGRIDFQHFVFQPDVEVLANVHACSYTVEEVLAIVIKRC